jgi:hypothetical protein
MQPMLRSASRMTDRSARPEGSGIRATISRPNARIAVRAGQSCGSRRAARISCGIRENPPLITQQQHAEPFRHPVPGRAELEADAAIIDGEPVPHKEAAPSGGTRRRSPHEGSADLGGTNLGLMKPTGEWQGCHQSGYRGYNPIVPISRKAGREGDLTAGDC